MPRRSLLVALLLARARASCPAIAPAARLDCGYVNISEALCASRGCCFDAAAANGTGLVALAAQKWLDKLTGVDLIDEQAAKWEEEKKAQQEREEQ